MGFYKKGFFRGQFYSLFVYLNRLGAFSHTCYEQKGPVFFSRLRNINCFHPFCLKQKYLECVFRSILVMYDNIYVTQRKTYYVTELILVQYQINVVKKCR